MIYDLHADLLCYLASHPLRLAYDAEVRCSIPQLLTGGVKLQTLAIFTTTNPRSVKNGMAQAKAYKNLATRYAGYFEPYFQTESQDTKAQIQTLLAIENASAFCSEEEPIEQGLTRLKTIVDEIDKPLYISLTWNTENRFGGGSSTSRGLKEDGKRLLENMRDSCYAVDLSHTSDKLAQDILTFIDVKKLPYKVIASHSNLRAIKNVPRNLPDEIADEIVKRGGVIGLNFIRNFLGDSIHSFSQHVKHALKRGYGENLALGADFFYERNIPKIYYKPNEQHYFEGFDTAASYPKLMELLRQSFTRQQAEKIAFGNLQSFLNRLK